jgi:hypothetical protein
MTEFEDCLKQIKTSKKPDQLKIQAFYDLCNKHTIEPVVLRITGEIQSKLFKTSYLLTFTATRIIVSKKNTLRNFVDTGYIAGLGPYLYYIMSEKVEFKDIKIRNSFIPPNSISLDPLRQSLINYSDVEEFVFYKGVKTLVTNMFGSAIRENFLKIRSKKDSYAFSVPVNKNGEYKKVFYWLKLCLPIDVYEK